ncbi:hypothetical protein EMIT0P253_50184 [Pseudomonas sp. IT-P253]
MDRILGSCFNIILHPCNLDVYCVSNVAHAYIFHEYIFIVCVSFCNWEITEHSIVMAHGLPLKVEADDLTALLGLTHSGSSVLYKSAIPALKVAVLHEAHTAWMGTLSYALSRQKADSCSITTSLLHPRHLPITKSPDLESAATHRPVTPPVTQVGAEDRRPCAA